MRVIVPLQGVVQGRGGLFLGSVIPCALFYFLQLYLRRNRSEPSTPPPPQPTEGEESSPSSSSTGQLAEVSVLQRSLSRSHLSPRSAGGPIFVSGRAISVAKRGDSPYDVGMRKVSENPYDELENPDGVFQLGLAENKVCLFFSGHLALLFMLVGLLRMNHLSIGFLGFLSVVLVVVGLGSRLAGG